MTGISLESDAVTSVLQDTPHLSVCILTGKGPHTTPELFTVAFGRLWCLTAATTLKAKVLADGGPVAVTASSGTRSVVALADAEVVDVAHPIRGLLNPATNSEAPTAISQFAVRNAAELGGAVRDLFTGKLGNLLPPRRVVLSIAPHALAVLDGDDVIERSGWLESTPLENAGRSDQDELDLLEQIPSELKDLAVDGPAVLGWTTSTGVAVAMPVRWDARKSTALIAPGLFELVGAASASSASIMFDQWTGFGPSGKQGVMLRGAGLANSRNGSTVVDFEMEGVSYWDGIETGRVQRG